MSAVELKVFKGSCWVWNVELMAMFVSCSLPMCFKSSHPVSFLKATCPSSPPTSWTGSPAFLLTSWSSSPPCDPRRWDQSRDGYLPRIFRTPENIFFFAPLMKLMGLTLEIPCQPFCFCQRSFFFFFVSVTPVWYICPSQKKKEKTQGWNKPEWVLLDHFLLYFLFIEVLFLCMEMLWRQNQDVWAKHCGPFCFFFFVFCDRHVNWKELSFCDGSRHFTLWFLNSSIQTSSLWLFLSRTCKSWVPVTWQPPPAPPPFLALLPLPPSSSAFNKPQYHLGDFEYGTL